MNTTILIVWSILVPLICYQAILMWCHYDEHMKGSAQLRNLRDAVRGYKRNFNVIGGHTFLIICLITFLVLNHWFK